MPQRNHTPFTPMDPQKVFFIQQVIAGAANNATFDSLRNALLSPEKTAWISTLGQEAAAFEDALTVITLLTKQQKSVEAVSVEERKGEEPRASEYDRLDSSSALPTAPSSSTSRVLVDIYTSSFAYFADPGRLQDLKEACLLDPENTRYYQELERSFAVDQTFGLQDEDLENLALLRTTVDAFFVRYPEAMHPSPSYPLALTTWQQFVYALMADLAIQLKPLLKKSAATLPNTTNNAHDSIKEIAKVFILDNAVSNKRPRGSIPGTAVDKGDSRDRPPSVSSVFSYRVYDGYESFRLSFVLSPMRNGDNMSANPPRSKVSTSIPVSRSTSINFGNIYTESQQNVPTNYNVEALRAAFNTPQKPNAASKTTSASSVSFLNTVESNSTPAVLPRENQVDSCAEPRTPLLEGGDNASPPVDRTLQLCDEIAVFVDEPPPRTALSPFEPDHNQRTTSVNTANNFTDQPALSAALQDRMQDFFLEALSKKAKQIKAKKYTQIQKVAEYWNGNRESVQNGTLPDSRFSSYARGIGSLQSLLAMLKTKHSEYSDLTLLDIFKIQRGSRLPNTLATVLNDTKESFTQENPFSLMRPYIFLTQFLEVVNTSQALYNTRGIDDQVIAAAEKELSDTAHAMTELNDVLCTLYPNENKITLSSVILKNVEHLRNFATEKNWGLAAVARLIALFSLDKLDAAHVKSLSQETRQWLLGNNFMNTAVFWDKAQLIQGAAEDLNTAINHKNFTIGLLINGVLELRALQAHPKDNNDSIVEHYDERINTLILHSEQCKQRYFWGLDQKKGVKPVKSFTHETLLATSPEPASAINIYSDESTLGTHGRSAALAKSSPVVDSILALGLNGESWLTSKTLILMYADKRELLKSWRDALQSQTSYVAHINRALINGFLDIQSLGAFQEFYYNLDKKEQKKYQEVLLDCFYRVITGTKETVIAKNSVTKLLYDVFYDFVIRLGLQDQRSEQALWISFFEKYTPIVGRRLANSSEDITSTWSLLFLYERNIKDKVTKNTNAIENILLRYQNATLPKKKGTTQSNAQGHLDDLAEMLTQFNDIISGSEQTAVARTALKWPSNAKEVFDISDRYEQGTLSKLKQPASTNSGSADFLTLLKQHVAALKEGVRRANLLRTVVLFLTNDGGTLALPKADVLELVTVFLEEEALQNSATLLIKYILNHNKGTTFDIGDAHSLKDSERTTLYLDLVQAFAILATPNPLSSDQLSCHIAYKELREAFLSLASDIAQIKHDQDRVALLPSNLVVLKPSIDQLAKDSPLKSAYYSLDAVVNPTSVENNTLVAAHPKSSIPKNLAALEADYKRLVKEVPYEPGLNFAEKFKVNVEQCFAPDFAPTFCIPILYSLYYLDPGSDPVRIKAAHKYLLERYTRRDLDSRSEKSQGARPMYILRIQVALSIIFDQGRMGLKNISQPEVMTCFDQAAIIFRVAAEWSMSLRLTQEQKETTFLPYHSAFLSCTQDDASLLSSEESIENSGFLSFFEHACDVFDLMWQPENKARYLPNPIRLAVLQCMQEILIEHPGLQAIYLKQAAFQKMVSEEQAAWVFNTLLPKYLENNGNNKHAEASVLVKKSKNQVFTWFCEQLEVRNNRFYEFYSQWAKNIEDNTGIVDYLEYVIARPCCTLSSDQSAIHAAYLLSFLNKIRTDLDQPDEYTAIKDKVFWHIRNILMVHENIQRAIAYSLFCSIGDKNNPLLSLFFLQLVLEKPGVWAIQQLISNVTSTVSASSAVAESSQTTIGSLTIGQPVLQQNMENIIFKYKYNIPGHLKNLEAVEPEQAAILFGLYCFYQLSKKQAAPHDIPLIFSMLCCFFEHKAALDKITVLARPQAKNDEKQPDDASLGEILWPQVPPGKTTISGVILNYSLLAWIGTKIDRDLLTCSKEKIIAEKLHLFYQTTLLTGHDIPTPENYLKKSGDFSARLAIFFDPGSESSVASSRANSSAGSDASRYS